MEVTIKSYDYVEVDSTIFNAPEETIYLYCSYSKTFFRVVPTIHDIDKAGTPKIGIWDITKVSDFGNIEIKQFRVHISDMRDMDIIINDKSAKFNFLYNWINNRYAIITDKEFDKELERCIGTLTRKPIIE